MRNMSTKRSLVAGFLVCALFAFAPVVSFGADMFSGTWRINLEKSTYSPGPPPKGPSTAQFKSVDNGIHVVLASVNATGHKTLFEYTVYFDGKEYPVTSTLDDQPTANAPTIMVSAKKIDDYTFEVTQKNNGAVVGLTKVVVAKDGKTHIATQTGTNGRGQTVANKIYLEKQ
jgi:hypothetical protein